MRQACPVWKIQHIPELNAFYIDVEDLGTYLEKIKEAGGKVIVERMEVPNIGAFSLFEDPDGRVLGLWLQQK